jgi:hypothetical protein
VADKILQWRLYIGLCESINLSVLCLAYFSESPAEIFTVFVSIAIDSSSSVRYLLAGLLERFEAALCIFMSPHFKDVIKCIRNELCGVSEMISNCEDRGLILEVHLSQGAVFA